MPVNSIRYRNTECQFCIGIVEAAMHERRNGLREGIARGLSQALVFGFEAQKTIIQVHGHAMKMPFAGFLDIMGRGMVTSACTSGIVFGSYFTVYHSIGPSNLLAGPMAAFTTSFVKIPISNSMRLMQAGLAKNVIDAGRKIVRARRVRGLYNGYGASLAEDIIEFDLRARMYSSLRAKFSNEKGDGRVGLSIGAFVGMLAAWVTTPFDTVRAHMAIDAAGLTHRRTVMSTAVELYKRGGVPALYRGATIRAFSNAIKSALFYMFFESLTFV